MASDFTVPQTAILNTHFYLLINESSDTKQIRWRLISLVANCKFRPGHSDRDASELQNKKQNKKPNLIFFNYEQENIKGNWELNYPHNLFLYDWMHVYSNLIFLKILVLAIQIFRLIVYFIFGQYFTNASLPSPLPCFPLFLFSSPVQMVLHFSDCFYFFIFITVLM